MRAYFQVKIIKSSGDNWYKGRIGQKFDISQKQIFNGEEVYITTTLDYIKIQDVKIIQEYPPIPIICRKCGYDKDLEGTKQCSYCNTEY